MTGLFSIAYIPPISYFQKLKEVDKIIIDQHEHYEKQSYRNRCCISGPNGKQSLSIPVLHENLFRTPINQVKMQSDSHWKMIHWRSIESAYRNSPYFEFYEEELFYAFSDRTEFLFEFNLNILKILMTIFKIQGPPELTNEYQKEHQGLIDFRHAFHPKINSGTFPEYRQVFSDRNGYQNDLSVIDYLFNCGPVLI